MMHVLIRSLLSIATGGILAMAVEFGASPAMAQTATSTPVPVTLTPLTATPTSTAVPPTSTSVPSTATATSIPATSTATVTPVVTSTPNGGSFIGGTVYEDQNLDQTFNSKEKTKKDVWIRLLDSSGQLIGGISARVKTNSEGYYEFRNLPLGTYLVTIEMPDGYFGTTSEQWEVRLNGSDGTQIADFGIFKTSNLTNTIATSVTLGGTVTTSTGTTGSYSVTAPGVTIGDTSGLVYTTPPTPIPTLVPTSTPTLTPIQKLKLLPPLTSARFFMEGHANDNGLLYDYASEGSVLQTGEVDMDLTINAKPVDLVALGAQAYVRPSDSDTEAWTTTSTSTLRSWYGVLSALDVMNLASLDKQVLDVRPTTLVEKIDKDTVRRVDVVLASQVPMSNPLFSSGYTGAVSSGVSAGGQQPANLTNLYPSTGAIYPQLRTDSGVTISAPIMPSSVSSPNQLQVIDGVVELWVGAADGYIRAAHLRLNAPSSRQDRAGRLEPVTVDTWVWYSEINQPFTISAPTKLAPPTPQPAMATAIAQATAQASSIGWSSDSSVGPIPFPVRGSAGPSLSGNSSTGNSSPGQSTDPLRSLFPPDASGAASERALLALASASGPRSGSKVTETGIMLDVPWRGVTDPTGAVVATDGPTSLGMILESFGVTAPTADLQALADRWEETKTDGEGVTLETLVRIAERGALRPIGTGRGPGGGDWTSTLARDFIRRGYPVLALVRPQIISDDAITPDQPDRFIVLVGYDGEEMIYHDPTVSNGSALRVSATTLDRSWIQSIPPRQGVVFGFGASIVGLLDGPGRSAQLKPEATATVTSIAIRSTPTVIVLPTTEPVSVPPSDSGPHPALLGFLGILAAGVGFLIARLYR